MTKNLLRYAAYRNETPIRYDDHSYQHIAPKKPTFTQAPPIHNYNDIVLMKEILEKEINLSQLNEMFKGRNVPL